MSGKIHDWIKDPQLQLKQFRKVLKTCKRLLLYLWRSENVD